MEIFMENKNLPENENMNTVPSDGLEAEDTVFDEDIYLPEENEGELTDDDLDISELLRKYLPDFNSGETDEAESFDESEILEAVVGGDADTDASEAALLDSEVETVPLDETEISDVDAEDYGEYSYSEDAEAESAEEDVGEKPLRAIPELATDDDEGLEIPEDNELDATDINLMVAFGLDDELAKTMGADVAAKLTEEIDAEAKEQEEKVRRSVENEYIDQSQAPEFAASMKKAFSRIKAKLVFASLFTVLLLLYENLELFGIQFGGALNPAVYPVVYIMMSLQIMLLCAAVGYEQLLRGCGNLFRGKIDPSSIAFVGNVAAIVYSVIQAETAVLPNEPTLFNSCAAAMTLFALIHDYLIAKRDLLSFNVISSKRTKYAVRYMSAADAGIPGGLFEDDDVSEGGVLRIEKTKFVDDFFARTSSSTRSGKGYVAAYLFISVIAAALMGVYVGISHSGNGVSVAGAVFVTFFATMPLSLFIAMSYPFYKGVSNAYELDGTVLGESSAEEYSEAGAVCFDDVDAFPSYGVKVQNIKIYNNHRIDRVLYYAASAFKAAGGPLSDVFEIATMEIGTSDNVEVKAAAEGYLGVLVDDKNIVFGRAEALREYGMNLPDSVTKEDETMPVDVCPMYMLREGKLMAKLLVKYMLDSDFEFLLKELSDEGMCACIKTFDPNIDDELITSRLGGGRYPFRVLRYTNTDEINRISDRLSGGIVSRGTTKPLLSLIGSCSKMLSMRKAGFTVGIVTAIIAALATWLLVASGGFASLSSFAVVVYQLLWALPVVISTKIFLR